MHAPYRDEDLTALATGDLGIIKALSLRRHLAGCAECRADWEDVHNLWTRAQAARSVTPDPSLQTRLSAVLPPTSRPQVRSLRWQPLAVFGIVMVAAFFVSTLFPNSILRPTVAFADVQKAMQTVKTASWTMTVEADSPLLRRSHADMHRVERVWVQQNPPMVISRIQGGGVIVRDGAGMRKYKISRGHYRLVDDQPERGISEDVRTMLRDLTERPAGVDHPYFGETPGLWRQQTAELRGHGAVEFSRMVFLDTKHSAWLRSLPNKRRVALAKDASNKPVYLRTETVWADPETEKIVRSEVRYGPAFPTVITRQHFEYDHPAPAGWLGIRDGAAVPAGQS